MAPKFKLLSMFTRQDSGHGKLARAAAVGVPGGGEGGAEREWLRQGVGRPGAAKQRSANKELSQGVPNIITATITASLRHHRQVIALNTRTGCSGVGYRLQVQTRPSLPAQDMPSYYCDRKEPPTQESSGWTGQRVVKSEAVLTSGSTLDPFLETATLTKEGMAMLQELVVAVAVTGVTTASSVSRCDSVRVSASHPLYPRRCREEEEDQEEEGLEEPSWTGRGCREGGPGGRRMRRRRVDVWEGEKEGLQGDAGDPACLPYLPASVPLPWPGALPPCLPPPPSLPPPRLPVNIFAERQRDRKGAGLFSKTLSLRTLPLHYRTLQRPSIDTLLFPFSLAAFPDIPCLCLPACCPHHFLHTLHHHHHHPAPSLTF
ncbi:hypothetical protein O3P69_016034 [Scylla paramamosain]|uniref:Uncharacterized protein n=1 Tax=Scylla paramamosain TaxID=85552 RepID=A0AAW0T9K2_SCYPA